MEKLEQEKSKGFDNGESACEIPPWMPVEYWNSLIEATFRKAMRSVENRFAPDAVKAYWVGWLQGFRHSTPYWYGKLAQIPI